METIKYLMGLLLVLMPSLVTADGGVVILSDKVTAANPVKLSCGDVAGIRDNDTIVWVYSNADGANTTFESHNPTVNITDSKATGQYICYLNDDVAAVYTAAKLTEAIILNTRKSVTYSDGDTNRKITCAVDGSYPDPQFIWTSRGEVEGEAPILVSSDTNPNFFINTTGARSVLTFYNVSYDDEATYMCDVKNAAGNTTVEVLIRVKDKYAAVWPFLGIVIEVVVLIAIIFLYEKHSKKSSDKEVDVPQCEDEKPLKSEEGVEIRNRAGSK